jgi:hypothetical protein
VNPHGRGAFVGLVVAVGLTLAALLGGGPAAGAPGGPHKTPKPKPTPTAAPTPTQTPAPTPVPPALTRLSTDPYTNSTSQHQTEVEPDIVAYGNTVVGAFQVGRFYDGGSSNIGWTSSQNGGSSWTNGFLPGVTVYSSPAGSYDRVSDPAVAYDAKHGAWLISTLPLRAGSGAGVLSSRSTDNGLTWASPVLVSAASGSSDYDKNWIGCDNTPTSPFFGNCYTAWDDYGNGNRVLVSRSTDGGQTWASPTTNNATVLGVMPLIRADGTVVVVTNNASQSSILAFRSTDGGSTWTSATTVAAVNDHVQAGGLRSGPLPSASMDGAGRIYVAWSDCRFRASCAANDIVYSTSSDGLTWSSVNRVPIDATTSGADHFLPGIDVDPATSGSTAAIGLVYYFYPTSACASSTCQLKVGFISSLNGGTSWSAQTTLAGPMTLSWLPSTNQGTMVGDYMATAIAGGKAWPMFMVAHAPSGATFDQAAYTVAGGMALTGGSNVNTATAIASTHGQSTAAQHRR